MAALRALAAVAAAGLVLGGCGLAQLHTARTTPEGEVDVTLGVGRLANEVVRDGDSEIARWPVHIGARWGVAEQVDVGARLLLGDGVLVDGQWGLLAPRSPWALSVSAGAGVGGWAGQGGAVSLTLPIVALASWDATEWLTPYLGVGWAFWWHLGREVTEGSPTGALVARAGHGDGVVTLIAGVSVQVSARVSLRVEYDFMTQALDDPGDLYSMVDSHAVTAAVAF